MTRMRKLVFLLILFLGLILFGCTAEDVPRDSNVAVPKGGPQFPSLTTSWIIDKAGVLSREIVEKGDAICQALQDLSLIHI